MSDRPRLAVYGSLAPGESNHHIVEGIGGEWTRGRVEGELFDRGWGAGLGYPAMVPKPGSGMWIDVWVLEAEGLRDHWNRLDDFEGDEYLRVPIEVTVGDKTLWAHIYRLDSDRPNGPTWN